MSPVYQRDKEGNVTNPPVIVDYEQRIEAAKAAADVDEIQRLHEEYDDARNELIDKQESFARDREAKRQKRSEERQQANAEGDKRRAASRTRPTTAEKTGKGEK